MSEESLSEQLQMQKQTIHEELMALAGNLNINADDSSLSGFSTDSREFIMSSDTSSLVRNTGSFYFIIFPIDIYISIFHGSTMAIKNH